MTTILTGIDLDFEPSCGSMILANELYEQLQSQGYIVHFVALKGGYISSWSKLKNLHLLNVQKKSTTDKDYSNYKNTILCEVKLIMNIVKPDIIHVHHLGFGMAEVLTSITSSIPKITFCHGTGILEYLNGAIKKETIKKIIENSEKVIFPTFELLRLLKNNVNFNLTNSTIIPWGVTVSNSPEKIEARFYNRKLIYGGRINDNKGLKILLQCFDSLPDNFTLDIFGNVNKNCTYLTNHRIKTHGFVDRNLFLSNLSSYSALIIPTQKIEAFGLVAIESQKSLVPVIYSKINGLNEILGESAIGFEPSNTRDLREKIIDVFSNKNKYYDLVNYGSKNAKKYTMENFLKEITQLTNKVLNEE